MKRLLYILGAVCWGVGLLAVVVVQGVYGAEAYSAQVIDPAERVSMRVGEAKSIWVEVKNIGTATWTNSGANAVKVGTVQRRDRSSNFYSNSWLSSNRLGAAEQVTVAPGETGRFVFEVTAGLGSGLHKEYFGLVAEGVAWFDDFEFVVEMEVLPTNFAGQLISTQPTIKLKAGEARQLTASVKNISDVAWNSTGAYAAKIGTAGPLDRSSVFYDNSWLSFNRVVAAAADVAPGGIAEFNFAIAAPSKIGRYREKFGIVVERLAWISEITIELDIVVEPAIYSAALVGKSENPILTPGEEVAVWVELRNEGNTVWTNVGDRTTKLGTAHPLDRDSEFQHSAWPSSNRAAIIDREVSPGGTGKFVFVIKAPEKIGAYTESFRPVVEYVTWMEDLSIRWEIEVNEELVLENPIEVGLTAITTPVTISNTHGLVVREGDTKNLVVRVLAGQSVIATPVSSGYAITASGATYSAQSYLRLIPLKNSILSVANEQISSTYNTFRGIVTIQRSALSGRPWIVNELELEDYLKGLAEVPNGWPLEARKAQVVAGRTFAMRRMSEPRADIFDIYDDTRDQVYYGYNYEVNKPGIVEAVEATRGIAVMYGGRPALTYYHSDSGGATDNVEDIWNKSNPGSAIPYLKGVTDPYAKPVVWQAALPQRYIQERFSDQLRRAGADSATVVDIAIDERLPSGRLKQVSLITSTGKRATMSIATFDYLTDSRYVKSMNFTVGKVGTPNAPDFVLDGRGNGHGVGMSQWSAYNMANSGQSYDQILKFFYTGVSVETA